LRIPWRALRSYDLVFEWRDPLPAVYEFWKKAIDVALKTIRRAFRKPSIARARP